MAEQSLELTSRGVQFMCDLRHLNGAVTGGDAFNGADDERVRSREAANDQPHLLVKDGDSVFCFADVGEGSPG